MTCNYCKSKRVRFTDVVVVDDGQFNYYCFSGDTQHIPVQLHFLISSLWNGVTLDTANVKHIPVKSNNVVLTHA